MEAAGVEPASESSEAWLHAYLSFGSRPLSSRRAGNEVRTNRRRISRDGRLAFDLLQSDNGLARHVAVRRNLEFDRHLMKSEICLTGGRLCYPASQPG